jgi:hypothetical protein
MLHFFLLFILTVSIFSIFLYKNIYIKTATMAVVMALGILTNGVLSSFFGSSFKTAGKILVIIDLFLWISFFISIVMTLFTKKFIEIHCKQPLNRFGIGTWIAGTSICGILLVEQLTKWAFLSKTISFFCFGLWSFYIGLCLATFYEIYKSNLSKMYKVVCF